MALMRGKVIPKDAVALDEVGATEYIWKLVEDWQTTSDVWALRYSPVILGGVNAFSGMIINRFYRQKLKLGNYGYLASVIPITIMPAAMTTLFHRHLVTTNILLMKNESCPICYEVRSAAIQISLGLAYTMVLGPASSLMLANRFSTARIPDLLDGPRVMFQYLRKISRPFTGTLTSLLALQLVASSVFTYYEMKNTFTIREKSMELETNLMADEDTNNLDT